MVTFSHMHICSQIDEVLIEYMVGVLSDLEQHAPVPDAVAMGTGRGHAPENSDADAVVAEVLVCFMEMMGAYLTGFSQLDRWLVLPITACIMHIVYWCCNSQPARSWGISI